MKFLKDFSAIKRAKKIINQLAPDLDTQIAVLDTEIKMQMYKVKARLRKPLTYMDRKLLHSYHGDLFQLNEALERYAEGVTKFKKASAYNSIQGIVKSMRKKYKDKDDHITALCEGENGE